MTQVISLKKNCAPFELGFCCKYRFMLADFIIEVQSIKDYVENIRK